MNKKANVGPIGAIFLFMVFLVNWFIWLSTWLSTVGQLAVQSASLTGLEAFILLNLNFVVFICMLLGMLGFFYLSSGD